MNEEQLRALVRDAVSRHLGHRAAPAAAPPGFREVEAAVLHSSPSTAHGPAHQWRGHASHHLYLSLVNVDGSCVIEPSVTCDHCGYCKSHGH